MHVYTLKNLYMQKYFFVISYLMMNILFRFW